MKITNVIKPAYNPSLAELPQASIFQGRMMGNSGTFMKCYDFGSDRTAVLDLETGDLLTFNSAVVIKDYVHLIEITLKPGTIINTNTIPQGTVFNGTLKLHLCDAISSTFMKAEDCNIIDLATGNGYMCESGFDITEYKLVEEKVLRNDHKN